MHSAHCLPVVLVKTSAGAGLSERMAVASPEVARSNVSVPDVVICPDGVTVTEIEQKDVNIHPSSCFAFWDVKQDVNLIFKERIF